MQAYAGVQTASDPQAVGVIIGKLERHMRGARLWRGYIAMLSVDPRWRRHGIGSLCNRVAWAHFSGAQLVEKLISEMMQRGAEEIVLETEADNAAAIRLYERMGFIREKRLYRFYLNSTSMLLRGVWLTCRQGLVPPRAADTPESTGHQAACHAAAAPYSSTESHDTRVILYSYM